MASFGESEVARLLEDASIVRHRGKIEAVINIAQRSVELVVGPATVYAFMQAMGLVNDHLTGGQACATAQAAREAFTRPSPTKRRFRPCRRLQLTVEVRDQHGLRLAT